MKIKTVITAPLSENCYIVYDEKTKDGIVIDPGSSDEKILKALSELEINLNYIIFTHGHFDHIGAFFALREAYPNAPLISSEKETEVIYNPQKSFLESDTPIRVDKFVSEKDTIIFGNCSLSVIETPGHTKGSICLYTKGTLFSGDTLFKLGMGRCDLPTGSLTEEINSIKYKLFTLPEDTLVYPGHGEHTTIGYEKLHNEVSLW